MDKDKLFKQWETEFYDKHSNDEALAEEDFRSIALGFFIAKGLTPDEAAVMYSHCISKGKY